jgi:aryl-alcohol dehydrogenase-like predicted oxidoreductase
MAMLHLKYTPRSKDSRRCAKAHGVALRTAALQLALAYPAVVTTIPGAARASELMQNTVSLGAANVGKHG